MSEADLQCRCPAVVVGGYVVRSLLPGVSMAFGDETLTNGIACLSLGAEHDGLMSGSFNHDFEKVQAIGAIDLCGLLMLCHGTQ